MAICHRANLSIYMVQALFQPTKESNKKPELDFLHTRHYSTFIHSTPPMKSIAQPPFAGDAVSVEVPSNTRLIPGSDGYLVNIALLPCYNSTPKDIMDNSFAIDMSFYRLANSHGVAHLPFLFTILHCNDCNTHGPTDGAPLLQTKGQLKRVAGFPTDLATHLSATDYSPYGVTTTRPHIKRRASEKQLPLCWPLDTSCPVL